jgi:hypothetical protein
MEFQSNAEIINLPKLIDERGNLSFIEHLGIDVDPLTCLNKFEFNKRCKIIFGAFLLFTDSEPLLTTIEVGGLLVRLSLKIV